MIDRVFCIDLGSAFTKVALRTDPVADSQVIAPAGAEAGLNFCVPTVVSSERRTGQKPLVQFGAAADRASTGGVRVYRNWKRNVFLSPSGDSKYHSPMEALLGSSEFSDLATRFDVSSGQVEHLRQMVVSARGAMGDSVKVLSPDSTEHRNAVNLSGHYLHWLRQQILAACELLPVKGLKFEAIPARIAVPAFAHGRGIETHPGCQALLAALKDAGWPLHPEQPLVTEPYSNAIGVLTRGKNSLTPKGIINIGAMFSNGPLITVLKDPDHHPTYRAMVMDVGAFTTDFAHIELDTEGRAVGDLNAAFGVAQHSLPIGVSDLDASVQAALPPDQAAWLKDAGSEANAFRLSVYAGKPYAAMIAGERARIGAGPEGEAIREAIESFCRRLTAGVADFCEGKRPAAMQELILTGGGSAIPAVRDALQQAAQRGGHYVKTYAQGIKKTAGGPPVVKLDTDMIRGGSALGGTSLYFG